MTESSGSMDVDWTVRPLDYEPPEVDTTLPHSARVYDYLLGGKDNYPIDRSTAEKLLADWPDLATSMRQGRGFMHRAVRYLAAERGIDQFLDLGTGIPTPPNLHEIAQAVTPSARVVYVDNDPIVLTHAEARLIGTSSGRIAYLHANLRNPAEVLEAPGFRATLDLSRPVAVSIFMVLHLVIDDREVTDLIRSYMAPLPPGSFLALSVGTAESDPERIRAAGATLTASGLPTKADRTTPEVEAFFDGLELIDPGVVLINHWRPDADAASVKDREVSLLGGVAIKR
jgi:hypothetical protein